MHAAIVTTTWRIYDRPATCNNRFEAPKTMFLEQIIVLALIQGITEFLPVSSSGHLILVPALTGWKDQGLLTDMVTNVGTLTAVIIYFWRDVLSMFHGLLDAVQTELKAAGRTLAQDLPHMYVSNHLAKALLKVRQGLANSEPEILQLLKAQFPQVQDVSNEQMVNAITQALSEGAIFPLTLIVLDEVQQYISDDTAKAYMVQEMTETRLVIIETAR